MQRYEITPDNERRLRLYCLPSQHLLLALLDQSQDPRTAPGSYVNTVAFDYLPEGYRVKSVDYSLSLQCWVVVIWHPEFPEVPFGKEVMVDA